MDITTLGTGLMTPALWAGAVVVFLILLRASNVFRYISNNQVGIVEKLWTTKGSISEGKLNCRASETGNGAAMKISADCRTSSA